LWHISQFPLLTTDKDPRTKTFELHRKKFFYMYKHTRKLEKQFYCAVKCKYFHVTIEAC